MYGLRLTYRFCAAHRLGGLPEGHKCRRMHGHNYEVTVMCKHRGLDEYGFLIDADRVDGLVSKIIDRLDHQVLNDLLDTPSSEMLAEWFYRELLHLDDSRLLEQILYGVEVKETDKITASFAVNVGQ
jgi:6-pyruvoyltetrahydropterin/6-carboxytetrahydropterin synthase